MSTPFLDLGDGAEIRLLEPDDAAEAYAVIDADRERLKEWMPWATDRMSQDDVQVFIETSRRSTTDLEALGIFVGDDYVGGIGLRVSDENGEIGYWISTPFEGRGLVTRACRALIDHAFRELGLHRVTITAAPDNARSRAIPERLGFREEGRLREAERLGDRYVDHVVYGILAGEWPPA